MRAILPETAVIASVLLTIVCILLIKKTSSISATYGKLLIISVCFSSFFDVYMQWIFDGAILLPSLCVYRDRPLINIPFSAAVGCVKLIVLVFSKYERNEKKYILQSLFCSLIALLAPIHFSLFIYRHQFLRVPHSNTEEYIDVTYMVKVRSERRLPAPMTHQSYYDYRSMHSFEEY
ncbi:hypothetical protein PRIPAC_76829 [Pristionchus pacificus]|uniref:Uncharacterized protein n=1 Tax=Pristionchus pacificus TaxID=54126 RepID=A0A2A6C3X6_PRIPA|nr:hypothetical protein PRIPAC_76829 [Pristionchus pacificus]|eukprot:PDM72721.1 hypothetical protein PRIPAC_39155 [Pristionchus pacificus]